MVFIGTDSGAATSKTGGVWSDSSPVSTKLRLSETRPQDGTDAVVRGWIEGVEGFLADNALSWSQVTGVGLALPGPYRSYGVLERSANLPASFAGWNFHADYSAAITARAGRAIPLVVGNDGDLGGVGEAARVRGKQRSSVVMLAPGSGLATAYIDSRGLPLSGEHLAGMEAGHMPTPLHLLGAGLDKVAPFSCGCGRTWGCVEAYTTFSGLPQYISHLLPKYADHPLATSQDTPGQHALSLRGLAQKGDPFALEICDMQAKALGIHTANLAMALDPGFVVIGGGLVDPEATTPEFRERYLNNIRAAAEPYLFPAQRKCMKISAASLGEFSQAIGAALAALYTSAIA